MCSLHCLVKYTKESICQHGILGRLSSAEMLWRDCHQNHSQGGKHRREEGRKEGKGGRGDGGKSVKLSAGIKRFRPSAAFFCPLFPSSPSHNEYLTHCHTAAVEFNNAQSLALFACEKTNWEICGIQKSKRPAKITK